MLIGNNTTAGITGTYWMKSLLRWFFAAPVFDNKEDKTYNARLLNSIIVLLLALLIAHIVILVLARLETWETLLAARLLPLIGLMVARWLMWRGRLRLSGGIAILVLWWALTSISYYLHPIISTQLESYTLLIVATGLLLGPAASLAAALFSIVFISVIDPLLGASSIVDPTRIASMAFVFVGVAFFLYLAQRYAQEASERARRYRAELEQTNRELQQQIAERQQAQSALEASEERYRTLLDVAPVAISVSDVETREILYTNPAAARLLQTDNINQLARSAIPIFVDPEYHDLSRQRHQQLLRGETLAPAEYRYHLPDGRVLDMDVNSLVVDFKGSRAIMSVMTDITERKRAEQALRESEQRYRQLLDASPIAIGTMSLETIPRILYVNEAAVRLMGGSTPSDVVGKPVTDFLSDASRKVAARRVPALGQGQKLGPVEYEFFRLDGQQIQIETGSILIEFEGGPALLTVFSDITERKRAEQALRESEERYRRLLEESPLAISVAALDDTRTILYINPAGAKLMGEEHPEDIVGKSGFQYLADASARQSHQRLEQRRRGETPPPTQLQLKQPGGNLVDVEIGSIEITYQGQPAVLIVMNNITERNRAHQELLKAESLRIELEKERRLVELRETFISIISHEFRTPLTVILSSKDLLERYFERFSPEQRQAHLEKIGAQVHSMVGMLDDILTVSRANAGMLEFDPMALDLPAYCQELLEEFASNHKQHRFEFDCRVAWNKCRVDPRLLRHMMINLLNNAAKYSPAGSLIRLELDQDVDQLVLRVIDEGYGIPADEMENLFEPFFRASNIRTIQGTGLGLPIAKNSAELHGGAITCDSQVGVGSTFTISLPLVTPDHIPAGS
jgi:PAS domain S-box-containing protein